MKNFKLSKEELEYLFKAAFFSFEWKILFCNSGKTKGVYYIVRVTDEKADELRDLCSEQLQITGFDKEYELTNEGKVLESLVDKFFTG